MIVRGEFTLGELVQFSSYSMMVYGPLQWMMNMPRWIANALIAVERVFSVIDEKPEVTDRDDAVPHRIEGHIRFEMSLSAIVPTNPCCTESISSSNPAR